jgi:hypothetical protein
VKDKNDVGGVPVKHTTFCSKCVRLRFSNLNSESRSLLSKVRTLRQGAISSMEYLEKILDALKNLARKVIDAVLGPEPEPELEPIPIPVRDRSYR